MIEKIVIVSKCAALKRWGPRRTDKHGFISGVPHITITTSELERNPRPHQTQNHKTKQPHRRLQILKRTAVNFVVMYVVGEMCVDRIGCLINDQVEKVERFFD